MSPTQIIGTVSLAVIVTVWLAIFTKAIAEMTNWRRAITNLTFAAALIAALVLLATGHIP